MDGFQVRRGIERGEGWRQGRDRPCAFGSWIVLRCAGVVGVCEEERQESQVKAAGFSGRGEV